MLGLLSQLWQTSKVRTVEPFLPSSASAQLYSTSTVVSKSDWVVLQYHFMTTLRLPKQNTELTSRPPQDFFKTFLSVQEHRKLLMDYFKPTSRLFLPSSAPTQLKSTSPSTLRLRQPSIEEFKYLPSSVSTQIQLQLSLNSTQSQLNSTQPQLKLLSLALLSSTCYSDTV